MSIDDKVSSKNIKILGICIFFIYLFASLFPKVFWGVHHVAFLPVLVRIILFFIGGYFIFLYAKSKEKLLHKSLLKPLTKLSNWKMRLLVSIIIGILFYTFPIHLDTYGDAAYLMGDEDVIVRELKSNEVKRILSFDFTNPKLGTVTTMSLISWLSYSLEFPSKTIFRLWDAFWGVVFIYIWLNLVYRHVEQEGWRVLLILVGLTAPFLLVFFGHFEIYAPVYAGLTLYFYCLLSFYQKLTRGALVLLFLSFIFCIKFHVTSYLLLPSILFTLVYYLRKERSKLIPISPRWTLRYLLIPASILGIILYFSRGSFESQRSFTENTWNQNVFLPVISSEAAPLDRYNLFSFYHFVDFGNIIFHWSTSLLFVLAVILIQFRKQISWKAPEINVVGVTALIQIGFFFLFNPLLSMPNDWDLMSIPAVTFLVFVLLLVKQVQVTQLSKQVMGTVFALSLFCITTFVVNHNSQALSKKLQVQGEWEFQTYWIGSSTSILEGIFLDENVDNRIARLTNSIERLEKYAVVGNDIEYAELLHQKGAYHYEKNDYTEALIWFDKADMYSTYLCKNHFHQLVCNFMLENYVAAHKHSDKIISCGYPNKQRAYTIALHTSLEAGDVLFADTICSIYLTKWPGDNFVREVQRRIGQGQNPKNLFKSKESNKSTLDWTQDRISEKQSIDSLLKVINIKRADSSLSKDSTFASLLTLAGDYYNTNQVYDSSLIYYSEALEYSLDSCNLIYQSLIAHFRLKQFKEARDYIERLVICGYPNPQKAYRVGIHTYIEANSLESAFFLCEEYLKKWPNDQFIFSVREAIASKENPEAIKALFQRE